MTLIINIGKIFLKIIYGIFKLFPVKENKVLFLSRQSDTLSLDFSMLKDSLMATRPDAEIISICSRLADGGDGPIKFGIATLRSMYHLARSSVCVLDAYWPAVSILHHKKSLTVIQMWHALGKIKQSGYQTLGRESGRSEKIARLMCMHRNYDIIVAGGKAWNPFYCKSFDVSEDKLVNIGLPRIDYLLGSEKENRQKILEKYPVLREKKVILYAPTFRRNIELRWQRLAESIDYDNYILIIKGHPNQRIECDMDGVLMCPEFTSQEMLSVCDFFVTDYSAIAIEGAILNKKTFYYVYDYEEYTEKNGTNIDIFKEMPGCVFRDGAELVKAIESGTYNDTALENYRKRFLPDNLGTSSEKLAQLVSENMTTEKRVKA